MAVAFLVTHPEVAIDPGIPVTDWHLSEAGIARMRAFSCLPVVQNVRAVWASNETKAIEAAGILAGQLRMPVGIEPTLHENDRSATGFLPLDEFERVADEFFAHPEASVRGWERAVDAQARIVAAVEKILAASSDGDIAFVSHGAVGTLLLCRFLGVPISRQHDQPFQGHYWAFDIDTRRVLHAWQPVAPR